MTVSLGALTCPRVGCRTPARILSNVDLPAPFFAHEGDAILLVDLKRNVFEECGSAEFDGQTINRYHERREGLDDEWTNEARGRETWRFDREEKRAMGKMLSAAGLSSRFRG